jgi:hypothetical protein
MFYGPGYTNNEAEATALMDACDCYEKLRATTKPDEAVRIWGDS